MAGILLGASVLFWRRPDRLTRRDVGIPALSIGLSSALVLYCWVAAYLWRERYLF